MTVWTFLVTIILPWTWFRIFSPSGHSLLERFFRGHFFLDFWVDRRRFAPDEVLAELTTNQTNLAIRLTVEEFFIFSVKIDGNLSNNIQPSFRIFPSHILPPASRASLGRRVRSCDDGKRVLSRVPYDDACNSAVPRTYIHHATTRVTPRYRNVYTQTQHITLMAAARAKHTSNINHN